MVPEESSLLACLSFPFDATAAPPRRNKRSAVGIFLDGSHCEPAGKPKRRPSTVYSYLFPVASVVSANTPNSARDS